VQAGNNFNVALKLTSDQPVRASPLQRASTRKLLETVAVGSRVSATAVTTAHPALHLVGASGPAARRRTRIPDRHFRRSLGRRELKLSSLVCSATGRCHRARGPARRTAIIQ